jgi:two-component system heavy metal sensor histidine kinase CusS
VSVESANGVNTFAFSVDASRIDVQGVRDVPKPAEERNGVATGPGQARRVAM